MRIGFDAKRAFQNSRGLGNYSRNLISGLVSYFPGNSYFLYGKRPADGDNFLWLKNLDQDDVTVTEPASRLKFMHPVWRSWLMSNDIKKCSIDIYHGLSHEIPMGLKKSPVKKIVTIHDLLFLRYKKYFSPFDIQIYTAKIKYSCKNSDKVIAVSEQTKTDLIDFLKIPENKIEVLYQSCSPIYYQQVDPSSLILVKKKYGLPDSFFLFIGALVEHKNIKRIIEALSLIPKNNQLPLVIIGKGKKYKAELQKLVTEKKAGRLVKFINYVDNEDMPAIYRNAKMLIWPSLFEGFGIPIIEALFCGTPVITSRTGCFAEAGGPDTIYVDPENCDEIADAINQVLENEYLKKKMITNGQHFVQKFHLKNTTEQLMNLYERL